MFLVKSDSLLHKNQDPVHNAIKIKWCKLDSNCNKYFYSFHCDFSLNPSKCYDLEKDLMKSWRENRVYSKISEFSGIIQQSYGYYVVEAGKYYIAEINEIERYEKLHLINPHDLLLEKRRQEMNPMSKDYLFPKLLMASGAYIMIGSSQLIYETGLLGIATFGTGLTIFGIGSAASYMLVGDYMFVTKFKSDKSLEENENWSKLVYFSVLPGQNLYLGDLELHLRARGGYGSSRRDAIIDISVFNNSSILRKKINRSFSTDLFKTGSAVGIYGVGTF